MKKMASFFPKDMKETLVSRKANYSWMTQLLLSASILEVPIQTKFIYNSGVFVIKAENNFLRNLTS